MSYADRRRKRGEERGLCVEGGGELDAKCGRAEGGVWWGEARRLLWRHRKGGGYGAGMCDVQWVGAPRALSFIVPSGRSFVSHDSPTASRLPGLSPVAPFRLLPRPVASDHCTLEVGACTDGKGGGGRKGANCTQRPPFRVSSLLARRKVLDL